MKTLWPQARTAIATSDTLWSPARAAEFVKSVEGGDVDIIIGTQLVTKGYHFPNLTLVGVGYRAQAQGNVINLSVGLSHPVNYPIPEGVDVETPTQTEIVIKGADKQKVGQVAADLRAFRPPEPYKGKGVRYADEHVSLKEAKKK